MANRQPSERKIQKVPLWLREVKHNSDTYDPKVVSFGPYHHGKPELQFCQNAKSLTLQMFVDGSGQSPEFFKGEVFKILAYARSCYVEGSTDSYTDEQFVDMMLLDACFLISFMESRIYHYLGSLVNTVIRDIFLLENQIPFQVVMLLINLRYGNTMGEEAVTRFLHVRIWGSYYNQQESEDILQERMRDFHDQAHPPLDLFEAFRRVLVWDICTRSQVNIDVDGDLKKLNKKFRSAMDLKAKGIQFKPSEKRSLKSINFQSFNSCGQLELPVWFVSDLTKVFFPNMIAYELCSNNSYVDSTVTSYVTFMKSLIEKPADVKVLREKRILLNQLGSDEDVVQLFRNLDTFEMGDYSFMEVKQRVQEHYDNNAKTWKAECDSKAKTWKAEYDSKAKTWKAELIHTYLSSPWSIIALFAAFLLLMLTFLQAYFTIVK